MASLQLKRRSFSQPQSRTQIDWNNPLARGLIGAFVPGIPSNMVDGVKILSIYTGVQPLLSVRKSGNVVSSSAYGYPAPANSASPEALLFDINVLSALVVSSQDASANIEASLFRSNGSSAPSWGIGLHSGTNNGPYAQMGSYNFTPLSGASFGGQTKVSVITGDGTNASVYMDGILAGSGTYTPATNQYSSGRQVIFGAISGTGTALKSRPSLGLVWNRALSPSEVKAISDNPWQLFKQAALVLTIAATGGIAGDVNVTENADVVVASTTVPASASVSVTEAADVVSSGVVVAVVAMIAVTEADDIVLSTVSEGVNGTASIQEADDTVSGVVSAEASASVTSTEVADSVAIQTVVAVSASTSITESADVVSVSSSVTTSASVSAIEVGDSVSSAVVVSVVASGVITEVGDSSASNVLVTITINASVTEAADSVAALISANPPVIITADIPETGDDVSSGVQVAVSSTTATTEVGDTSTISVSVAIAVTSSGTEVADAADAIVEAVASASGAVVEVGDSVSSTLSFVVSVNLSVTEAGDTVVSRATVTESGGHATKYDDKFLISIKGNPFKLTLNDKPYVLTLQANQISIKRK